MGVAVMVMVFLAGFTGKLFHGNNATMEFRAVFMLELNGGVGDVEVLAKNVVELDENAVALRGRNVGNGDMAGQGAGLRAETPDMEIMNIDNALNFLHAGANILQRAIAGRALEKNIEGFADDADA
jgi:hypothetical protein